MRLPRKIKKKYGEFWKIYLGLYIIRKSSTKVANKFLEVFNSVLRILTYCYGK